MADGISFSISHEGAKGPSKKTFTLRNDGGVVRIGRAPGNDVVVDHRGASQYHAELRYIPNSAGDLQLQVKDLSMNGTGIKTDDDKAARHLRKNTDEAVLNGSTLLVPMLLKASNERAWLKVEFQDLLATRDLPVAPAAVRAHAPLEAPLAAGADGSGSEQDEDKDAEKSRMQFVELLLKTREICAGSTYDEARNLLSANPIWDAVDETTRRECFEIFVEHLGNHSSKKGKKKEKGAKGKKDKRRHHEEETAQPKETPPEAARGKRRKEGEKKGSASAERHRKTKRDKKGRERSRGRSCGNCSRSPSRQKKRRRGRSNSG